MAQEQRRFSALDLRHVAGIIARIGTLPGVPTTDWCVRAAAALTFPRSGMRVRVGIFTVKIPEHAHLDGSFLVGEAGTVPVHSLSESKHILFSDQFGETLAYVIGDGTQSIIKRESGTQTQQRLCVFIPIDQPVCEEWLVIEYIVSHQVDIETITLLLETILPYIEAKICFAFDYSNGKKPGTASPAEHRVLEQLILGLSIKKIAEELERSPHTVHDHVKSLHRKFNANSRGQLIARVLGYGSHHVDSG